jgi:hypothetical protein
MATLELGVLDVAYTSDSSGKKTTTGDVAEILESNYHVMETFAELRKQRIADFLAQSMANALQDRLNGRTATGSPMFDAEQRIEADFRAFLDANEMNRLSVALTGQAISAAAARGVNRRKKNPFAKANRARVAFVDTGLYRDSFRAVFKP